MNDVARTAHTDAPLGVPDGVDTVNVIGTSAPTQVEPVQAADDAVDEFTVRAEQPDTTTSLIETEATKLGETPIVVPTSRTTFTEVHGTVTRTKPAVTVWLESNG